LASHTLLGPIGATVFTDMLSILALALCLPIHLHGFDPLGVLTTLGWLMLYVPGILIGLSWVAKRLLLIFGATKDSIALNMLLVMAIAAQVSEWIGMEGIIGAFLAGVAVKRAFGETKGNDSLEVISHVLFIPVFLITAGFLVDFQVFFATLRDQPLLVFGVLTALFGGKWLAAQAAALLFKYQPPDRNLMFSLTIPQVAATLAVALVAYSTKNDAGLRLIDAAMLNATVVLVIISSLIGLLLTERAVEQLEKSDHK